MAAIVIRPSAGGSAGGSVDGSGGGRDERTVSTFCRICEAHCGLEVTVGPGDEVLGVRPDREHPVSRGFACVKGTSLGDLHHDPDRVDRPLKRIDGDLVPISWEQALAEIGARVRGLRAEHGPRSIGMYTGNPTFFSFANIMFSGGFLDALGSPNLFASHSVDVNNKFAVSTLLYGLPTVHPVPDLERCEVLLLLGTNPAISQMSVVQAPDALSRVRSVEQRGGRVVVVDPRRSETAAKVGDHLAIRPGTDAYLLLALLHVVVHEIGIDPVAWRVVTTGLDEFLAVSAPWTPERVAPVCGLDAAQIRDVATAFAAADGACAYLSTGVNMGPFGSVSYWLLQGLNLVTGNLDRPGGVRVPGGPFDVLALAKALGHGEAGDDRTLVHGWRKVAAAFPVAALAEEITTDHPERIRALFVSAGNPLHSVPGGELAEALDHLDLLVSIDIYVSETGARADYVLPATDMLERSDYPVAWAGLQVTEHAQWTPAVVAPAAERRPEWQIFSDLAVACGAPALGSSVCNTLPRVNRWLARRGRRQITPDTFLALLLRTGGKVSMADLRRHPRGVLLPETPAGSFLSGRVPTIDGRVHLAPPELLADLRRVEAAEADHLARAADLESLVLIGRRERRSHNSWMHNNPGIRQPESNTALLHPADAGRRGISDDDLIEVVGAAGTIRLPVKLTDTVREGVVVVPHGWDHTGSGLGRAVRLGGANPNRVVPGGSAEAEPVSGQAIMLGRSVTVRPAHVRT